MRPTKQDRERADAVVRAVSRERADLYSVIVQAIANAREAERARCTKVARAKRLPSPNTDWAHGYNRACDDIGDGLLAGVE